MVKQKCLLFLIFAILICKVSFCQKDTTSNWYWGISTDFRQCFRTIQGQSLPGTAGSIYHRNLEIKSPFYLGGGGFYLGRFITNKISVEAGVSFENKHFQTGFDPLLEPPSEISTRFIYEYFTFQTFINYQVKIKAWFNICPSIGCSGNIPLTGTEKRKAVAGANYLQQYSTTGYKNYAAFDPVPMTASFIARLSLDFRMKSFSVGISPFYSYTFTPTGEFYTNAPMHFYVYGVSFLLSNHFSHSNHRKRFENFSEPY